MEKQHLKRLGYGFSALVMALSAVSFVPTANAISESCIDVDDTTIVTNCETKADVEVGGKYYVKKGDTLNYRDIVNLPESANENWKIEFKDKGGDQTYTWKHNNDETLEAIKMGMSTYDITVTAENGVKYPFYGVEFYVYRDVTEVETQYVKLGTALTTATNLKNVYANKYRAYAGSDVTFTNVTEDAIAEKNNGTFHVNTSKVGKKVVHVAESLNGTVIAEQDITFIVYGVEVDEAIAFWADEGYDLDLTSQNATRFHSEDIISNIHGILLTGANGNYHFSVDKNDHLDQYKFQFTVEYRKNAEDVPEGTDTYLDYDQFTVDVNVYDKMYVASEDATIDLAKKGTAGPEAEATFTINFDDGVVEYGVPVNTEDESIEYLDARHDRNTVVYTANDNTTVGDYKVTFLQTVEGTNLEYQIERTVHVINSETGEGVKDPNEGNGEQNPDDENQGDNNQGGDNEDDGNDTPNLPSGDDLLGAGGLGAGADDTTLKAPDTGRNTTEAATTASSNMAMAAAAAIAATTLAGAAIFSKRK